MYLSIEDGDYEQIQDMTNISKTFDIPLTFGASINKNGKLWRYFKGVLKNMKVEIYE